MKLKRFDKILILIVLFVAAAFVAAAFSVLKTGEDVIVTIDGKEYGRYDLKKDQVIEIKTEYGCNTLEIKDGKVDMTEADCPDQICVKESPLEDDTPRAIVCLPHKLVVELRKR